MATRRASANIDPRDQAAYPLGEAARFLKLPAATLRAWTHGRSYPTARGHARFRPLIKPTSSRPPILSFWNLIEAHVLRALRTDHGVSIKAVREAVAYAEASLDIDRLLLRPELRSKAGDLFLERYGELVNLSASGQLAMKQVLDAHLQRVTWDASRFPIRLHPFVMSNSITTSMPIAIDPNVSFGRPVVAAGGISTAAIVERIDAGEQPEAVARDYGLMMEHIEHAVLYERAA